MFVVCKYTLRCLVGGWLLGGIFRAGTVALLGGRKGELEGEGEERRYSGVCKCSGEKREERSYYV